MSLSWEPAWDYRVNIWSPGQSGDQKINLPSSCSLLTLHRPVENNNNFLASQMFCKDQFVQSGPPVFREVKTSANFSIGSPPIIFLLHQRWKLSFGPDSIKLLLQGPRIWSCQIIKKCRNVLLWRWGGPPPPGHPSTCSNKVCCSVDISRPVSRHASGSWSLWSRQFAYFPCDPEY